MVELNSFLLPVGSPIERNQTQVQSGYDWNSSNERGAITSQFIRSLSFSQAQGGTAVLGGSGNGNGVLEVRNASGGTVVQLDYNGLTINNGSITINNNSGSPVVDAYGVNSQNVFVNSGVVNNSLVQTVSGTTEVSLTGGTMTFISNRNNINYLFLYTVEAYLVENPPSDTTYGYIRLYVDGVGYNPSVNMYTGAGNRDNRSYMAHALITLNSGTHTAILKAANYNLVGTANMVVQAYKFTYCALGQ